MPSDKAPLYAALEALQPRNFNEIPLDDTSLADLLTKAFSSAEIIVNSVPISQPSNNDIPARTCLQPAVLATSTASVTNSTVSPPLLKPEHEELKVHWGKPLKLNARDNPLDLSVYKLSPNDKHGAWFARRSIHQGIPFEKWKRAMRREFAESISVKGGPGAGAIRGIGAERRLEKKVTGVGKLEVYHLSAQFPGPTSPRDFVTLLLTADDGLSEASVPHDGKDKTAGPVPQHYMVVSIPVDHPDAPVQGGLVRGQYESVEMIREIPVAKSKSNSTSNLTSIMETDKKQRDRGSTIGSVESRGSDAKDEEVDNRDQDETTDANPVEWIMITRSDPGGGIPKFMVERGTPSSIAGDAVRFIDWVTSQEDLPSDEDETEAILDLKDDIEETATIPLDRRRSDSFTFEPSRATDTGVIAALTSVVREGLDNYAPESLQNSLSTLLPNALPTASNEGDHDDSSTEVSSLDSFASAEQFTTAPEPIPDNVRHEDVTSSSSSMLDHKSLDRVSLDSGKTSTDSKTRLDKRLAKFEEQRKKLEADLAKSHSRGNEKLKEQRYREEKDVQKARERAEREKKRREEKYTKEMQKLERKKEAEERKAEEKRKKAEDADMLSNMKRQRDQSRRMAEVLRKENEVLRERLGELQRENTLLVQRVVKLEGGKELLRDIREELGST